MVKSASWAAEGGPEAARLEGMSGRWLNLPSALELLRCGVELVDENGAGAWWGYVSAVEMRAGHMSVKADLDLMSNRVKLNYTRLPLESNTWIPQHLETSWSDALVSQGIYGVKEKIVTLPATSYSQALSTQLLELNNYAWPLARPIMDAGSRAGWDVAFTLKGWWSTLGWRYYSQTDGIIENLYEDPNFQDSGAAAGNMNLYQSFTVGALGLKVGSVWLKLNTAGAPGDNLQVDICADNAGAPGASQGSTTIVGSSISHTFGWYGFILSPLTLAAGSWWIWIHRTGASNGSNYYRVKLEQYCLYTGGVCWLGAGLRAPAADLIFRVLGGVETTAQAVDMASVGAGGQFLAGVRLMTTSGIYANQFRLGTTTALEEIQKILAAGNSSGIRLLGQVTQDRYLNIYLQPDSSIANLAISRDGVILDQAGRPLPAWKPAAGQWAKVSGAWSELGAINHQIVDRVLLERVEYEPISGALVVGAMGCSPS